MQLHRVGSTFVFATHFHEIVEYEEVRQMTRLTLKHMAVTYDREMDCLVYDRLLKNGSGPRVYGLEVCKSLHLEKDFIDLAYSIRNKYFPDVNSVLTNGLSRYNQNKVRSACELCGSESNEVHHMSPQKEADQDGFIGSHHKNHPANLMNICEKCHVKVHKENAILVRKKTSDGHRIYRGQSP
jgi:DNA mismatch repair protein MutS